MIEPISIVVLLAGFAAFGDKLVDLLIKLRADRVRRDNIASQYFSDLSDALSKVVEGLRENRIPRIDGNRLQDLLKSFGHKTQGVSGLESPAAVKASLENALTIAKTLDGWLLMNVPSDFQERCRLTPPSS